MSCLQGAFIKIIVLNIYYIYDQNYLTIRVFLNNKPEEIYNNYRIDNQQVYLI